MDDFVPLGMEVFDSLRAENEDWLIEKAFVWPPDHQNVLSGNRSMVVYGAPGSGKSALGKATFIAGQRAFKRLTIRWDPQVFGLSGSANPTSTARHFETILEEIAAGLLQQLWAQPDLLMRAENWVKEIILACLRNWLGPALPERMERMALDTRQEALCWLRDELLSPTLRDPFNARSQPKYQIQQLFVALQKLGVTGIWVVVDGLEGDVELRYTEVKEYLEVFLSSLFLFEDSRLCYKLFLPAVLHKDLSNVSVFKNGRAGTSLLRWDEERLLAVANRRLALATGKETFDLGELFDRKRLLAYLTRCGGMTPRNWLEYLRPVVGEYLDHDPRGKLSAQQWERARLRTPHRVDFDPQSGEWVLDAYKVVLTGQNLALLAYLYQNAGRYCSMKELYTRVYVPSNAALKPEVVQSGGNLPSDYEDLLNTALWRLRDLIEPDPRSPVFVVTRRGKGTMFRLDQQD